MFLLCITINMHYLLAQYKIFYKIPLNNYCFNFISDKI